MKIAMLRRMRKSHFTGAYNFVIPAYLAHYNDSFSLIYFT